MDDEVAGAAPASMVFVLVSVPVGEAERRVRDGFHGSAHVVLYGYLLRDQPRRQYHPVGQLALLSYQRIKKN